MEGRLQDCKNLVPRGLAFILVTCAAALAVASSDVIVWGPSLGPDSKGLEAAIRAFEAKHPEYRLKLLSLGARGMNPQKLMTAIVGTKSWSPALKGR